MRRYLLKFYHSKHVEGFQQYWFLLAVCTIFILLRLPSLIEPHWYGDEGIYQVLGRALNDGRVLYRDIWDNKPPLLYIIYAVAGGNLFVVKLFSLIAGLLSVVAFFLLSRKIFKKDYSIYLSTLVFATLFGLPVLEGNIANAENFMILPIIMSGYLAYSYAKQRRTPQLIAAGFLLSIAFSIKTVAIFDAAAFLAFLLFTFWGSGKLSLKAVVIFIAAVSSMPLLFSVYFLLLGAFQDFINGVFLQNISYVSEQYGAANPTTILAIKTVVLALIVIALFIIRNKITTTALFIYLWVVFGIYNIFFSDRPYTHYLLVLLPAFSLLLGCSLEKWRMRLFEIGVVIGIMLAAYYHFQIYRKNISYYQNYIQFVTNNKEIKDYQSFFDRNTPRDYKIANFIKTNVDEEEEVLLLSDSAQIYALSDKLPIGKYVVAYHISYYENALEVTREQIGKVRPQFIIMTSANSVFEELLSSYELRYIMDGTKIYER